MLVVIAPGRKRQANPLNLLASQPAELWTTKSQGEVGPCLKNQNGQCLRIYTWGGLLVPTQTNAYLHFMWTVCVLAYMYLNMHTWTHMLPPPHTQRKKERNKRKKKLSSIVWKTECIHAEKWIHDRMRLQDTLGQCPSVLTLQTLGEISTNKKGRVKNMGWVEE